MDKKHSTSEKPSSRLIGQPPMTGEERAAFLQQARAAEAKYDNEVGLAVRLGNNKSALRSQVIHVGESSLEFKFHANYPHNLMMDVHAKMQALGNNLKLLDSALPSNTLGSTYADDREWLKDLMEDMHTNLKKSLQRLDELYLEKLQYDVGTPSQIAEREDMLKEITNSRTKLEQFESDWHKSEWYQSGPKADIDAVQKVDGDTPNRAWHKQWVDPSQPLKFTEGFRRTAESGGNREPGKPAPEFKPNVAPDNARALYTSSGEADIKQVWHQDPRNFSYELPISDEALKRASKLGLVAMGLLAASEAASATPGLLVDKLTAAGHALKDIAIDAVPGVTYLEKMQEEKYAEAALDAASYLPLGDIVGMARSPEVQAVIDALPKGRKALESMMGDKTQAPIDQHLAEYQLILMEAKNKGEFFKGLDFSSALTDLAEKKIIMQAQWAKNAEAFVAATSDPSTDWNQVKDNHPDIAMHVAMHLAAMNSGRSSVFVNQVDANLTDSLARGRVLSIPETSLQESPSAQVEAVSLP